MRINYVSAAFDGSGYASAARNYIAALDSVGVEVHVHPLSFEESRPELGRLGDLVKEIAVRNVNNISEDITISHVTPNILSKTVKPGTYNIGYCAWETSRLPPDWVDEINKNVQEVWVPCTQNWKAFKESGVTVPVIVVPHCFNQEFNDVSPTPILTGKEFKFLSVFQWLERKNPFGLVKAYYTEFAPDEPVSLTLKTYVRNAADVKDVEQIKAGILQMKQAIHLKEFPKIHLVAQLLSSEEVNRLYIDCDAYITLHRGEGFGVPCAEAMLAGKPVIASQWAGTEDFVNEETGYPVKGMLTPVFGMPWPQYTGLQNWFEPDLLEARRLMREVYVNREDAAEKGLVGKEIVTRDLSWARVGFAIKQRLEQIMKVKNETTVPELSLNS